MKKNILFTFILSLTSIFAFCQDFSLQAQLSAVDTLLSHKQITEAAQALENVNKTAFSQQDYIKFLNYYFDFLLENSNDNKKILAVAAEAHDLAPKVFPNDLNLQSIALLNYLIALNHSSSYKMLVEWQEANFEKTLKKYKDSTLIISTLYFNCGFAQNELGNFSKGDDYMLKSIALLIKANGEENYDVAKAYYRYGYANYERGEYQKAIQYYEKALTLFIQLKGVKFEYNIRLYSLIGEAYTSLKIADKALEYQLRAMKMLQENSPDGSPDMVYFYNALASAYSLNGDNDKALETYQKVIDLDPDFDYVYTSLARIYNRKKEFALAHQNLDKSWKIYNYSIGLNFDNLKAARRFSRHLLERAVIYKSQFDATNDATYLAKAAEIVDEAKRLSVYNINRFPEPRNKKRFYEDALSQIERALDIDYQYFMLGKSNLKHAFDYVEFGKGFLLHQAMEEQRFLAKAEVPQTIKTKEKNEKLAFEKLEKTVFEQGKNDTLQNQLFDLKQTYIKTQNEVKNYCKSYYNQSVFDLPENTLRTAQDLLDNETTLLNYVVTAKKIYVFVLQKDKANWYAYDKNFPLEQSVTDFTLSISMSQKYELSYPKKAKQYVELATFLYAKLIAPIAAELKQNVIIIPDKILANLPFDALITKASDKTERFQQHQYLLQDYNISYCNSIDLLSKMQKKNSEYNTKNALLAIAPFYDNSSPFLDSLKSIASISRDKLDVLPYSGEEIFKVAKIMGGKTLTGVNASKNDVTKLWNNYQILHFATHGKANFEQGEFSYLAFSPTDQDKRLYVKDIYNFDLNHVEMVVLSACESGIGEQQIGEGSISIARAFAQVGAKSIVTTLWSINDEKTKDIMAYFYKNLKTGMTKSKALQQAKITYLLSQKGNNAHPFFWAAFELIGNTASIK